MRGFSLDRWPQDYPLVQRCVGFKPVAFWVWGTFFGKCRLKRQLLPTWLMSYVTQLPTSSSAWSLQRTLEGWWRSIHATYFSKSITLAVKFLRWITKECYWFCGLFFYMLIEIVCKGVSRQLHKDLLNVFICTESMINIFTRESKGHK